QGGAWAIPWCARSPDKAKGRIRDALSGSVAQAYDSWRPPPPIQRRRPTLTLLLSHRLGRIGRRGFDLGPAPEDKDVRGHARERRPDMSPTPAGGSTLPLSEGRGNASSLRPRLHLRLRHLMPCFRTAGHLGAGVRRQLAHLDDRD